MTAVKRLGLAGIATASLGAVAASLAVSAFMRPSAMMSKLALNVVIIGGVGTCTALALLVFWRGMRNSVKLISSQLETMAKTGELGLVMDGESQTVTTIARPLNELLSVTHTKMDEVRAENRELLLQCRIAAAETRQTEEIIFSISDAVIVTNRFDELILANDAAEELLGFELSGSLRKGIDRVLSDGTLVRLIRETRAHGRSFKRKVVEHSIDNNGSPRTYHITLSCIVAPTPRDEPACPVGRSPGDESLGLRSPGLSQTQARALKVCGVVAVLQDVTREKEIAQMKTDFVSNVSHELKTPLASIKAYVEMLVDGEAADETTRDEFYQIISTETDRLHRLIENILNISRIESGVVKVAREPVNLTAVAKQALDVAAPQAKAKSIELVDRLAPVYYQVEGDRDMIYQAILNLLSNAIKYTPEGGTVTVSVTMDERRGVAVCEIADTGMGIPPEDLPHVFDKFFRVGANKKAAKGTGLGLTLVKHIVETLHDGKLTVASETGKGSSFSFALPVMT